MARSKVVVFAAFWLAIVILAAMGMAGCVDATRTFDPVADCAPVEVIVVEGDSIVTVDLHPDGRPFCPQGFTTTVTRYQPPDTTG